MQTFIDSRNLIVVAQNVASNYEMDSRIKKEFVGSKQSLILFWYLCSILGYVTTR